MVERPRDESGDYKGVWVTLRLNCRLKVTFRANINSVGK